MDLVRSGLDPGVFELRSPPRKLDSKPTKRCGGHQTETCQTRTKAESNPCPIGAQTSQRPEQGAGIIGAVGISRQGTAREVFGATRGLIARSRLLAHGVPVTVLLFAPSPFHSPIQETVRSRLIPAALRHRRRDGGTAPPRTLNAGSGVGPRRRFGSTRSFPTVRTRTSPEHP